MKPEGNSRVDQIDAAKITTPTIRVIQRCRTEARTSEV